MPGGKATERDHLNAAAKRGDARAKQELAGPPFPAGAEYLWGWFGALDAARGSSGFGASAISWTELEAFSRLQGIAMKPWEVEILRALDRKRMESASAEEDDK